MPWKIWLGNPWPRPFLGGFWAKWPPKYITVSFWPPKGTSTHEIESFDILTKFFRSSVRPVRWIPFLAGNPWPRPFFDLFLGLKGSKKWKIVILKNWGKKATGNHVVWHINHLYRSNGLVCTLQKPLLYIHTYIHTYIHRIKIVIFHPIVEPKPLGLDPPNFAQLVVSPTESNLKRFIVILTISFKVEHLKVWPFPFKLKVAVNTV